MPTLLNFICYCCLPKQEGTNFITVDGMASQYPCAEKEYAIRIAINA
jgi:hypothetical protein